METLFRKVFTKDRLPDHNNYVITDVGNLCYHPSLKYWSDGMENPEWWLEPIDPANRERAIEIADKAVGTYSNDLTKSIASSVIDALINEGLLLGKSVEIDWEEIEEEFRCWVNDEFIMTNPSHMEVFEWFKGKFKSLSSSIVSEEEINSAAFEHEKDTENSFRNEESFRCGALWYRDKASSSIVYPESEDWLKTESIRTFQGTPCVGQERIAYKSGWDACIEKFKSLNSSRESEPMTFEEFYRKYYSLNDEQYELYRESFKMIIKAKYEGYLIGIKQK